MATQLLSKVKSLVSGVGNGMEDSETEMGWAKRAVTVRLETSGRDSDTWKRKDKVID